MQVDTFEAVKNNVYSVLGDLAKDLHGPELDLLFSKFEACTGWPAPDTLKAMDLLKRLAHSDDEARLFFSQNVPGWLETLCISDSAFNSSIPLQLLEEMQRQAGCSFTDKPNQSSRCLRSCLLVDAPFCHSCSVFTSRAPETPAQLF